jgi:hypothetical protein
MESKEFFKQGKKKWPHSLITSGTALQHAQNVHEVHHLYILAVAKIRQRIGTCKESGKKKNASHILTDKADTNI